MEYSFFGPVKLKPLIKWSGGKHTELSEYIPKHLPKGNIKLYIEPFAGGAATFFKLDYKKNVIADVHEDLINFYLQIKEGHSKEIYKLSVEFGIEEEDYYQVRDKLDVCDPIVRAAQFYYLRKTCFRGMLRYNKKKKFNIPWGRYGSVNFETILDSRYETVLKTTEICLCDFEKVFKRFNSSKNFVFLDPPYDSTFTDYGYCTFGKEYQEKLAEVFKKTKNKCLMVISETEFINKLYKGYIVDSYLKNYKFRIHSGRVGDEIDKRHLIIKNY